MLAMAVLLAPAASIWCRRSEPLRRASAVTGRRTAAAGALARRGGADAIELLQWTAAADVEPSVIRAAIEGLTRIGAGPAPQAMAAIRAIAALAADPIRRADVIGALAGMPDAAISRVGDALSSAEPAVRRAVVEALGRRTHPAASAYVVHALGDGDASVRQVAVTILSRLGTRGVRRTFAELAASDPSEAVRRAAALALRRIGTGPDADQRPRDTRWGRRTWTRLASR